MQFVFATVLGVVKKNRRRILEVSILAGAFALIAMVFPQAASASPWDGVLQAVNDFKAFIVSAAVALCVIGLVLALVGHFMRTQEGLGPVMWTGIVCTVIGVMILIADTIVSGLQSY